MRARLQDRITISRKKLNEELTAAFIAGVFAPTAGFAIAKVLF